MENMHNHYLLVRHGESLKNVKNFESCWPEKTIVPLTKKGERQIKKVVQKIKNEKIDLIFSSDILRTKQTAQIVGKALGLKVRLDKRLREVNLGILNGRPVNEIGKFWDKEGKLSPLEYYKKRFQVAPPKGETYVKLEKKLSSFIREIEKEYNEKNILIVGHQRPLTLLEKVICNYNLKKFVKIIMGKKEIKIGELRKIN